VRRGVSFSFCGGQQEGALEEEEEEEGKEFLLHSKQSDE
jgi:hypothetical protein